MKVDMLPTITRRNETEPSVPSSDPIAEIRFIASRAVRPINAVNAEPAFTLHQTQTGGDPQMLFQMGKHFVLTCVYGTYKSACQYSGGFVKLRRDFRGLPLLERSERSPVFLFDLVTTVNGLVDYDEIVEEYPGLTYAQIHGAFVFLRRLSQFNTAGLDIDEWEQKEMAQDQELIAALRQAINQGGDKFGISQEGEKYVLNATESDND